MSTNYCGTPIWLSDWRGARRKKHGRSYEWDDLGERWLEIFRPMLTREHNKASG